MGPLWGKRLSVWVPSGKNGSGGGEGPLHGVGGHLVSEVVLDAENVGANALAAMGEAVAVAFQPTVLQHHLVVAIGAVHSHPKRLVRRAGALEALRLLLVAVRL